MLSELDKIPPCSQIGMRVCLNCSNTTLVPIITFVMRNKLFSRISTVIRTVSIFSLSDLMYNRWPQLQNDNRFSISVVSVGLIYLFYSFIIVTSEEELKICRAPQAVQHSSFQPTHWAYRHGHVVEYVCYPGFVLAAGNGTMSCRKGLWEGHTPSCIPISVEKGMKSFIDLCSQI